MTRETKKGNPNLAEDNKKTRFSSTNQPENKGGRKPSKLRRFIKDNKLSAVDVSFMIRWILVKDQKQLMDLYKNPKYPMLVRLFAATFLDDFEKRRLQNLEILLRRAYGDPEKTLKIIDDDRQLTDQEIDEQLSQIIAEGESESD